MRPSADGHQHGIGLQRFDAAGGAAFDLHCGGLAGAGDRPDRRVQLEAETVAGKKTLRSPGKLAVDAGQDTVEILNHRHFGAEARPDLAELKADDAGADHHKPLRHLVQRQGAGR